MKDEAFFNIKFTGVNFSLFDILAHLYFMYKLGKALSYEYVYTPFICKISYPLNFIDWIVNN